MTNENTKSDTLPAGIKAGSTTPPKIKTPPVAPPAAPPVAPPPVAPPVAKPIVKTPTPATPAPVVPIVEEESNIIASHDAAPAAKSSDIGDKIEKDADQKDKENKELLDVVKEEEIPGEPTEEIFVPEDIKVEVDKAFGGDSAKLSAARGVINGMTGPFFTDYYFRMKGRFSDDNIKDASLAMIKYAKILVDTMEEEGLI